MLLKPMRIGKIHLFSGGLSEQDKPLTGIECAGHGKSPLDFIRKVIEKSGSGPIALIPEGPYAIPLHRHAVHAASTSSTANP